MKKKLLSYTVAAGIAAGLSLSAQAKEHHKGTSDESFAMKAAAGGLTEVEAGKLAQENGGSQEVKDFGAKMVTDHGKANDQLKAVAEKDKLTIPDKPNAEQQAMLGKLGKEKGEAFDKIYLHMMLMAHRKDLALFKSEAENGSNADLKQFAKDTAPVVKSHLEMLESMKGTGGTAESGTHHHHAKPSSEAASNESKSGVGPGGTGAPATQPPAPDAGTSGQPGASTSADSKGGVGPAGTGNPTGGPNGAPVAQPSPQ